MKTLENCFVNLGVEELEAVTEVLRIGKISGTAPVVAEYEASLRQFYGVEHALAVASGTAAWHILLIVYGIGPGDEVILPPTAPVMSALPVLAVGATPVFADTYPMGFGLDPADVELKLTARTRAVLQVPMWGYPVPTHDLARLCDRHELLLIEDASHSHGSLEAGNLVGKVGDASFFSTQERKLVTTGEGGFILTDSDSVAEKIREVRDFGKLQQEFQGGRPGEYGHHFGLNFRISAIGAALGIQQIAKLPLKIQQRLQLNERLSAGLDRQAPWLHELRGRPTDTKNCYSFAATSELDPEKTWEIQKGLFEDGIVSDPFRFGGKVLHRMPIFEDYASDCSNAEKLLSVTLTLPTHEGMHEADVDRIIQSVERNAAGLPRS